MAVAAGGWWAYASVLHKHKTTTAQASAVGAQPSGGGASSGASTTSAPSTPSIAWKPGTALVSNGSKTVTFDGVPVAFPTTVTDAVFSPDGSQIAFVDGDGDVAVALLNGAGEAKVTAKHPAGEIYSRPAWLDGISIQYAVKSSAGRAILQGGPPSPPDPVNPPTGDGRWVADGDSSPSVSAVGSVHAFQRQGKSGPEVWWQDLDPAKHQQNPSKIGSGSEPAVSPDGKQIAFVGAGGAIEVTAPGGKPSKIGSAAGPTHLAWTPDGKAVAFSTAKDIEQIPAAGGTATALTTTPGTISFLPARTDRVIGFDGTDPVAESIALSKARWPSQQTAPLPTGYGYLDDGHATSVVLEAKEHPELALAAGYTIGSAAHNGPLLFTSGTGLDAATSAEIKRVLGTPNPGAASYNQANGGHDVDTVILLGGEGVISPAVDAAVKALGYQTIRTAASDTISMALKVGPGGVGDIAPNVVAASVGDPSGIAAAVTTGDTVVLTDGPSLPAGMKKLIDTPPGGPGGAGPGPVTLLPLDADAKTAISGSWAGKPKNLKVRDLSAKGPGAASAALLQTHTWYPASVIIVPKGSVTDAVIAAAAARTMPLDVPVLTVDPATGVDADTLAVLKQNSAAIGSVYVVDVGNMLPQSVRDQLGAAVSGPLGWDAVTDPQADAATK